jgi:peptidoglycan L-alanyl-D-glutamate endopeptidase CwlK
MFSLSTNSQMKFRGVHPDLIRVARRAITITTVDFGIADGLRSLELQQTYVAEGKSKSLNSKHLAQSDGYSHAIDVYGFANGKASYDMKHMRPVMQAFVTAAILEGVKIKLGGLWPTFVDTPHIELDLKQY